MMIIINKISFIISSIYNNSTRTSCKKKIKLLIMGHRVNNKYLFNINLFSQYKIFKFSTIETITEYLADIMLKTKRKMLKQLKPKKVSLFSIKI